MNRRTALATAGLAAALALAPVSSAQAAPHNRIDVTGQGTYTVRADGVAVLTGTVTGSPFSAPFTAYLRAQDGSLPAPGECEPGSVTLFVDGPRHRYLTLTSADDVCGVFVQPPYVVTHQFAGTYSVSSTTERRLRGGDGFLEVRLAEDGRGSVFAIDT